VSLVELDELELELDELVAEFNKSASDVEESKEVSADAIEDVELMVSPCSSPTDEIMAKTPDG